MGGQKWSVFKQSTKEVAGAAPWEVRSGLCSSRAQRKWLELHHGRSEVVCVQAEHKGSGWSCTMGGQKWSVFKQSTKEVAGAAPWEVRSGLCSSRAVELL